MSVETQCEYCGLPVTYRQSRVCEDCAAIIAANYDPYGTQTTGGCIKPVALEPIEPVELTNMTLPCSGCKRPILVMQQPEPGTYLYCYDCTREEHRGWFDRTWGAEDAARQQDHLCRGCNRAMTPNDLCGACTMLADTPTVAMSSLADNPAYAETQPTLLALPAPVPELEPETLPSLEAVPWTEDELNGLLNMTERVQQGAQSDYDTLGERAYYSVRGYARHSEVRVKAGNRRWFSKVDVVEALERAFRAGGL